MSVASLVDLCLSVLVPDLVARADRYAMSNIPAPIVALLFQRMRRRNELNVRSIALFMHTKLTRVDLSEYRVSSREFMSVLSRMQSLRELSLEGCAMVSEEGFQMLANLSALASLDVSRTRITDRAMLHLAALSSLQCLNVSHTKLSARVLAACLVRFPLLVELSISGMGLSDADIVPALQQLRALEFLDASQNRLRDAKVHMLPLRYLNLSNNPLSTLYWVGGLSHLGHLNVDFTTVTGKHFIHLRKLDLGEFFFPRMGLEQEDVERLSPLTSLVSLDLSGASAIKSLSFCTSMRRLASLDATGCAALTSLQGIDACPLEELRLQGCRSLPDEQVLHVAALGSLTTLDLKSCALVGDTACRFLARSVALRELNLSRTQVTDVGLSTLSSLTRLQLLDLAHTDISADSVSRLRRALAAQEAHPRIRDTTMRMDLEEDDDAADGEQPAGRRLAD